MKEFEFDLHLTPWAIKFLRWIDQGCPEESRVDVVTGRQYGRSSHTLIRNEYVSYNPTAIPAWTLTKSGRLALDLVEERIEVLNRQFDSAMEL